MRSAFFCQQKIIESKNSICWLFWWCDTHIDTRSVFCFACHKFCVFKKEELGESVSCPCRPGSPWWWWAGSGRWSCPAQSSPCWHSAGSRGDTGPSRGVAQLFKKRKKAVLSKVNSNHNLILQWMSENGTLWVSQLGNPSRNLAIQNPNFFRLFVQS